MVFNTNPLKKVDDDRSSILSPTFLDKTGNLTNRVTDLDLATSSSLIFNQFTIAQDIAFFLLSTYGDYSRDYNYNAEYVVEKNRVLLGEYPYTFNEFGADSVKDLLTQTILNNFKNVIVNYLKVESLIVTGINVWVIEGNLIEKATLKPIPLRVNLF